MIRGKPQVVPLYGKNRLEFIRRMHKTTLQKIKEKNNSKGKEG